MSQLNLESSLRLPDSLLGKIGWALLPGSAVLCLELVYEQTLLTWSQGDQMVGFRIMHVNPLLTVLGLASIYAIPLYTATVIAVALWSRLKHRAPSNAPWPVVLMLLIVVATVYIPYSFWKRATVTLAGPGPHAGQFLVYAAHDGDLSMVKLLLNKGVSVDTLNGTSTALNGACAGGQTEIARFLLTKGADLSRTTDCDELRPLLR
jgi:hypothetical protein